MYWIVLGIVMTVFVIAASKDKNFYTKEKHWIYYLLGILVIIMYIGVIGAFFYY